MLGLNGTWWKPGGDTSEGVPVPVIVRGFGQASISDGVSTRPVAIVQETGPGARMRYVDLRYLSIEEGHDGAQ